MERILNMKLYYIYVSGIEEKRDVKEEMFGVVNGNIISSGRISDQGHKEE